MHSLIQGRIKYGIALKIWRWEQLRAVKKVTEEKAKHGERLLMKTGYNLQALEEWRPLNDGNLKYKYTMKLTASMCWKSQKVKHTLEI